MNYNNRMADFYLSGQNAEAKTLLIIASSAKQSTYDNDNNYNFYIAPTLYITIFSALH